MHRNPKVPDKTKSKLLINDEDDGVASQNNPPHDQDASVHQGGAGIGHQSVVGQQLPVVPKKIKPPVSDLVTQKYRADRRRLEGRIRKGLAIANGIGVGVTVAGILTIPGVNIGFLTAVFGSTTVALVSTAGILGTVTGAVGYLSGYSEIDEANKKEEQQIERINRELKKQQEKQVALWNLIEESIRAFELGMWEFLKRSSANTLREDDWGRLTAEAKWEAFVADYEKAKLSGSITSDRADIFKNTILLAESVHSAFNSMRFIVIKDSNTDEKNFYKLNAPQEKIIVPDKGELTSSAINSELKDLKQAHAQRFVDITDHDIARDVIANDKRLRKQGRGHVPSVSGSHQPIAGHSEPAPEMFSWGWIKEKVTRGIKKCFSFGVGAGIGIGVAAIAGAAGLFAAGPIGWGILAGIVVAGLVLGGIALYVDHRAKRSQEKSLLALEVLEGESFKHGSKQEKRIHNIIECKKALTTSVKSAESNEKLAKTQEEKEVVTVEHQKAQERILAEKAQHERELEELAKKSQLQLDEQSKQFDDVRNKMLADMELQRQQLEEEKRRHEEERLRMQQDLKKLEEEKQKLQKENQNLRKMDEHLSSSEKSDKKESRDDSYTHSRPQVPTVGSRHKRSSSVGSFFDRPHHSLKHESKPGPGSNGNRKKEF